MNTDVDLEIIMSTAQKSFKQKLKKLNESIRNSAIDIENDPLLLTLREDSATEAFVPLRLKELHEDRTTKGLIEGLKKELSQALTEYYIEYNKRQKLEKILENEKLEKKEATEETGILKLSIKELEINLENLRVKYENGIKIKQNEAKDYKIEYHKNKSIIEELEKQLRTKHEETSKISEIFDRERAESILKEEILADLKRENEDFRRKLKIIESDHNELSIKFRDAHSEIEFLNSELYKINEERTELEESTLLFKKSLSLEKEKEVSSFKGQVNDIKKRFSNKLSEVKEELSKKSFDLENYKTNIADLEKLLADSQKQFSKEKNELIELLESSKTEFKGTIAKLIKKHENDIFMKTSKYEADIEELKSFYKTVIKSQLNEFEARTSAFLQREKEKDDHIMNLAKQTSQNFIETKTHQLILSEKIEESKILNQKLLVQAEYETKLKWEKDLKNALAKKNSQIEECKQTIEDFKEKIQDLENQIKDEQQKTAEAENFLNSEKSKFEDFSKNFFKKTEDLQAGISESHEKNSELSSQNTELKRVINELKQELFDLQTTKTQLEHKNQELESKLKESLNTLYEQTSVSNRNINDLHNEKLVLWEKIKNLEKEVIFLQSENQNIIESNKIIETRFDTFKSQTQESLENNYLEIQAEKENFNKTIQKSSEENEFLRQENEKLVQKIQNKMQDNLFLLTQLDRVKEDLALENSRTDHLQNLNFGLSEQIKQLDEINFSLKEELRFLKQNQINFEYKRLEPQDFSY